MHLLLTDRMACPRCGPAFGLVLRSDVLQGRRVLEGGLGCPNCREVYPVTGGHGDLRPPPRTPPAARSLPAPDPDQVEVARALLGVAEGPGEMALVGEAARYAPLLSERTPGVEMVAMGPGLLSWTETAGVSRLLPGGRLPFADRTFRGVLLEGSGAASFLREAARVLAPRHRVVVLHAPEGASGMLMASGLTLQLEQDGVVIAGR